MPINERIDDGPCGCPRFVIARDVVNGDTVTCAHTDECKAERNKPPKAEKPEPKAEPKVKVEAVKPEPEKKAKK